MKTAVKREQFGRSQNGKLKTENFQFSLLRFQFLYTLHSKLKTRKTDPSYRQDDSWGVPEKRHQREAVMLNAVKHLIKRHLGLLR